MPRGRLIFPLFAEIARYDTEAMETASRFDDDYREPIKVDTDADGIGEDDRLEKTTISIKAQIERSREELQRLTMGGDVPDSAVGLIVHMRDMEKGDGIISYVEADGSLIFKVNDRLIRILDRRGIVTDTFDSPRLYCSHVLRLYADIGRTSNLALLLFGASRALGRV